MEGKAEAPFSAGKGIALHYWYCQGQAASRFGKKSPRLRFAPGSIFPGNLDSTGRMMLFALKRELP
ncbi:MAG: hypothetical protein LBL33_04030 [Tannerella sp.]|jgi:hypothetical protein|nr:hypothetical protein [Tannerella sp.]